MSQKMSDHIEFYYMKKNELIINYQHRCYQNSYNLSLYFKQVTFSQLNS